MSVPWTCSICGEKEPDEADGLGSWWCVLIQNENLVACSSCHAEIKPFIDLSQLR